MTISAISATQTNPAAETPTVEKSAAPAQKSAQSQTPSNSTPTDTVQISSAARAAIQEATETQTQTTREAQNGDLQAQRLLAKEAAAKKAEQ